MTFLIMSSRQKLYRGFLSGCPDRLNTTETSLDVALIVEKVLNHRKLPN